MNRIKILCIFVSTILVKAEENATLVASSKLTVLDESVTISSTSTEAVKHVELIYPQPTAESRSSVHSNKHRQNLSINSSNVNNKKPNDFRPSQPLETYYEYNRFPVVPAMPEAKHYPGLGDKPSRFEQGPWIEKANIVQLPSTTVRSYNNNKIQFPTTQATYQTINEQDYSYLPKVNYMETPTRNSHPYVPSGPEYTSPKTPSNDNNQGGYMQFGGTGVGNAISGIANKFGGLFGGKDNYFLHHPTSDEGPYGGSAVAHKTHFEPHHTLIPVETAMPPSPWKKVIGFLTTIIPLGLLLSALTPSFITVSSVNNTEARGRANDRRSTKDLIHSLRYINALNSNECEEKVICEIMVRTGSTSPETNSERLLKMLSEHDKNIVKEHRKEINVLLNAIKTKNCNLLACNSTNGTQIDIMKKRTGS